MTNLNHFEWKERASLPLPRAGCAVGMVAGRLVVAGGTYWHEGRKYWSDQVDGFDPLSNRWESQAPMPRPCGDAAAVVHKGTLHVFGGGGDGATETTVWSFRNNAWSALPHLELPAPRRSSTVAVLDGTIYLLGGLTGTASDFASATSTLWAEKPEGGWESREPMPGPARFTTAVGAVGGRIIVAGGCTPENGNVRNLDEILSYCPSTNTWTFVGRLPFPNRGACGLADDSGLLMFGGYTDKFETGILRYDLPSNTVQSVGQLPTGLAIPRFVWAGSHILGVSGENGVKMRYPGTLQSI